MAELTMLETVGQVAGIGGIALGVLTLVFRDVIRKNIFPNLSQVHAYRLIRMVVVLTFCIAAIGIGAWAFVNWRQPERVADPTFPSGNPQLAVDAHLQLIDNNRYADAYSALAAEGKKRIHRDLFTQTFENQRKPRSAR